VPPADCPIKGVSLSQYVVSVDDAGKTVKLSVHSPGAKKVTATFNGKKDNVTLSLVNAATGLWQADLTVPFTEDRITSYPISVKSDNYAASSVATLVVRRSTYPTLDVAAASYVVSPGGAVTVTVRVNNYTYGQLYALRVDSKGNEEGDFGCLRLSDTSHYPNTNPEYPGLPQGANGYREYLGDGFPEAIHLGDVVYTEPGNMQGPNAQGMDTRFAGDNLTFAQWVAAGKPASRRVVFLPVVEKMDTGGKPPLRVVAFAAFYVEPTSDSKSSLTMGRFIQYVAPSDSISEDPAGDLYVKTVRLVAPE
jgi:hypothetical protein